WRRRRGWGSGPPSSPRGGGRGWLRRGFESWRRRMCGNSSSGSSPESMTTAAVIVAGGSGRRMGGMRKQYLDLLGEPVLLRSVRPFLDHARVGSVVVVLPAEDVDAPPDWLRSLPITL